MMRHTTNRTSSSSENAKTLSRPAEDREQENGKDAAPEAQPPVGRLRAVAAAAAGVIGAGSREALRNVLEEACRKVIPFDAFFVLGYDAETDTFQGFGGYDAGLASPPSRVSAAGTPGARVIRERRSLLTLRADDPAAQGARLTETGRRSASVIRSPILSGDEVIGILAVHSYTPDLYTALDVEVIEVIASLAATALANLRLAEERKEAGEAIQERERQLREAQSLARLGSWCWMIGSDRVVWSDEMFRIYGLPPHGGEIAFEDFVARLHPDDRALVLGTVENARREGRPYEFLHRIVRPDGTTRLLHARGDVVLGPDGAPNQMFGTGQDITELKAAEEALRASEESYRTIFELASDAIFVHDIETGAILDANRKACELHGCTLDELKALGIGGISDGRPPFDGERAQAYVRRAAEGEPQRFEWLVRRKTGERFWVEVSLHRVRILGDARILASVRHIDERKQAEAALQRAHDELEQRVAARTAELADRTAELAQAEQRFRAIVEASPTPLLLSRLDDGAVLYANDRLEALLGAAPGSLRGRKTPDFYFDLADRPKVVETVRRQGYVRDLELRIKRTDDTPRWVSLSVQRLAYNGVPALATALIDITERKQTEEALRASEESYRSLFDNLTELVYIQDLEGRFLNVNEAVVRAYGYTREELVGQTPGLLAAPGRVDVDAAMACFHRAVAGEPQRFDWWGRRKDGTIFPKEVVIKRSTYFGQDVVIAVARNISDRVEAEAALRRSEEHFRRLTENASDLISILDMQGLIHYQSPAVTHMLGHAPEEMVGKNAFEYMAPEDVAPTQERLQWLAAHPGTPVTAEFRFRHKDGSWRYIESVGTTFSPDTATEGVVVNSRDITERKRAEATLRLQKTLLEAQGEASIDGILVVSEAGKILSYNQRFVELWNLPPEVVASRSDEAAIQTVLAQLYDPEAFLARVAYLYDNPEEKARDEIALRDGRVFDRYSAPVISSEGDYYGRIWFFRDMTVQKRHAEELEQARYEAERAKEQANQYAGSLEHSLEELRAAQDRLVQQEKLASLGQLTAGIAHEIKNPLNFVNNFAVLSRDLVEDLRQALITGEDNPEELLADLEQNAAKIEEHGLRADAIIKSMMQHARGGRGQRQAADLNALVEEYIHLAFHGKKAQTPGSSVEIERDLGEAVGLVETMPQEFGRVLLNLVDNAFDAVYERAGKGHAAYRPLIKVSTRRIGDQVEIRVEDNGPGIPAAMHDRIFEPFFTTKPPGRGTGLGLSLSYDIVTQGHGGTLLFESEEGRGTTFIVRLPATYASR